MAVDLVAASAQSPEFERTPPQNIEAEQCVLGGMLLSKDAIADVVESLRSMDFYRPAHSMVFDVIVDLYGRGEPADAVTVAAELSKQGELQRVGGAPYLHTLVSAVPTAASAGYYARIVAEQAVLRRLVEAGTHIVQLGYGGRGTDVDDIVDRAQQAVFDVTERRASEDYIRLEDLLQPTLDEIEAISSRDGTMAGVPTGFADLDRLTNGLHPGQLVIVAARPAIGKALALDTPLPTPHGWTTMAAVRVGDTVLGGDGRPSRVVAATGVMTGRPCYLVRFSDGTTVVADGQHLWATEDRAARRAIQTTEQLAATLRARGSGALKHLVPLTAPLQLPARTLGLHPYPLGVWLGHRHPVSPASPTVDREIAMYVDGCIGRRVDPSRALGAIGVLRQTHIPVDYLRASEPQRRDLLAGLLDADGVVTRTGTVQFATTSRRLAADVQELIVGLGYQARLSTRDRRGAEPSASCTVSFEPDDRVFRLDRKHLLHKERAGVRAPGRAARFITDVRRIDSVPVRCIEVDNPDHLYLASRSMIPTHNSTLGLDLARAASIRHNLTSVIFSLEMSRNEITMRLLSAEARVHLQNMRTGRMSDDDWARLARRMGEVASAPLFIDDSPNMTMMEIRAKARRLRQRNDLKLIVLDYMQLMSSPRKVENRQQEVSEISRSLKLLAKELEIPVVAISQLNRGPEQRADKKPQIADLRESGCMTADTTLLRADTGAPVSFRELMEHGHDGVLLWSLDEDQRLVPAPITNVFSSGVKPVFRLRLASGREVKATGNHPFLTRDGWMPLERLSVGDRVAVAWRVPEPISPGLGWSEHRLGLLAHLIGDGCVARSGAPHYMSGGDNLPVPDWVSELGIDSRHPADKRLPEVLHSASNSELATFLRYLWAADGTVTVPRAGKPSVLPRASYVCSSRALAGDVALLLARLGIRAHIHETARQACGPRYEVGIDARSVRTFCTDIGGHGRQRAAVDRALAALAERHGRRVESASDTRGEPDIGWDRIAAIEPLGEQPVFDATVKGTHNFVADGIVAHNSLEQDADLVILLYREDAFEKESPRAGEADFIVAKHRNGPTDTITVAFQGHYSRFVDMAPG